MSYLANADDPGIAGVAWTTADYDDAGWSRGLLGLGYNWTDDPGRAESSRILTTFVPPSTESIYSRTTFRVAEPGAVNSLKLALDYEDGVVAWINGVEVYRSPEMPPGVPSWDTRPSNHESSNGVDPDFSSAHDISSVAVPLLRAGENVLAVGVWNEADHSSDLVLVPRLWANDPAAFVIRGPYL